MNGVSASFTHKHMNFVKNGINNKNFVRAIFLGSLCGIMSTGDLEWHIFLVHVPRAV